jgi:hypothetical protein
MENNYIKINGKVIKPPDTEPLDKHEVAFDEDALRSMLDKLCIGAGCVKVGEKWEFDTVEECARFIVDSWDDDFFEGYLNSELGNSEGSKMRKDDPAAFDHEKEKIRNHKYEEFTEDWSDAKGKLKLQKIIHTESDGRSRKFYMAEFERDVDKVLEKYGIKKKE